MRMEIEVERERVIDGAKGRTKRRGEGEKGRNCESERMRNWENGIKLRIKN